ncbi:MAG: hypothetical protein KGZ59_00490 [Chitinophagaceae bacterium]|nr:hypothetical protein [Chitinophagaceae bacterium]
MLNIIIFSKPIHSGKTTELLNWVKGEKECYGVLMPELKSRKYFYNINDETYFEADIINKETSSIKTQIIGKYCFNDASFKKANQIIIEAFQQEKSFIVIDEIGKLELRQEGFFECLQTIFQSSSKKNLSLLLVVRDTLLDEVNQFFQINEFKLIHSIDELNV